MEFFNLEIFIFVNSSKIYSTEFLLIFPDKNMGSLAFKIDAISGKKWVKFVTVQQNSATLIYDS